MSWFSPNFYFFRNGSYIFVAQYFQKLRIESIQLMWSVFCVLFCSSQARIQSTKIICGYILLELRNSLAQMRHDWTWWTVGLAKHFLFRRIMKSSLFNSGLHLHLVVAVYQQLPRQLLSLPKILLQHSSLVSTDRTPPDRVPSCTPSSSLSVLG